MAGKKESIRPEDEPAGVRMTARTNQRIDGRRLWDSLMDMAAIGATPKGGVRRLSLTEWTAPAGTGSGCCASRPG